MSTTTKTFTKLPSLVTNSKYRTVYQYGESMSQLSTLPDLYICGDNGYSQLTRTSEYAARFAEQWGYKPSDSHMIGLISKLLKAIKHSYKHKIDFQLDSSYDEIPKFIVNMIVSKYFE